MGMIGVAVPILDAGQDLVGSLGVVLSASQALDIEQVAERVETAGQRASAAFTAVRAADSARRKTNLTVTDAQASSDDNSRIMRKTSR